jgi:hypothetical protein
MKTIKTVNGNVISSEEFFNDVDCRDYIEDILLPEIEVGNWNKLETMYVIQDNSTNIMFSENSWSLQHLGDGYQVNRILFNHSTRKNFEGYILPRNIRNEIKCFACIELFTDYGKYAYLSIVDTVSKLTEIAKHATEIGIASFSEIDEETLLRMADNGLELNVKGNKTLSAINRIVQCQDVLPINIEIKRNLQPKDFNLQDLRIDPHFAIPHRIYFKMLNSAMDNVNEAHTNRIELEKAVEKFLSHSEEVKEKLFERVRKGEVPLKSILASPKNQSPIEDIINEVIKVFKKSGVSIVDFGKDDRWNSTWDSCDRNYLNITASGIGDFHIKVGTKKYKNRDEFLSYIRNLQADSAFLCMSLSGMRISEMFGVSPVYGAQDHLKIGTSTIYAFTTKQEKLTLDSQTADDVYITNLTGFKAYHVLNAIHKPYRKRFTVGSQSVFFAALSEVYKPRPIGKSGLGETIRKTINRTYESELSLKQSDIEALRVSNPLNSNLPVYGDVFSYTNHQSRRSFAYYLIGLELMDFPQLKQQLGHISIAMTRWYANNAHSFKKLYGEIQDERTQRLSRTFARIYNRLANKERLAGGLGNSLSKTTMANQSFFSEGINNRKLDADFWESEIKTGKVHIHAIGKGMYCTKRQCGMRVAIDLSECTDCAWDIIEDALSVESLRMTAMINLLTLIEDGELNGGSAAKLIMDIRSAERIMIDLGFPFEIFDIPEDAAVMITIKEVL